MKKVFMKPIVSTLLELHSLMILQTKRNMPQDILLHAVPVHLTSRALECFCSIRNRKIAVLLVQHFIENGHLKLDVKFWAADRTNMCNKIKFC